jgi:hypothetical protein
VDGMNAFNLAKGLLYDYSSSSGIPSRAVRLQVEPEKRLYSDGEVVPESSSA